MAAVPFVTELVLETCSTGSLMLWGVVLGLKNRSVMNVMVLGNAKRVVEQASDEG